MGMDIIPLAYHHRLDISSDENFSSDIAEKFSGNVTLFMEDDELKLHELFKVEKADHKINISIIKGGDSDIPQLLYRVDLVEDALNHYSMEIYPHHVDMYLMDAPFRWGGFENCIRFKEEFDLLKEYRSYIKDLCDTMGCDVCLFIPDQGCTEYLWEETQKGMDYDIVKIL